MLNLPTSACRNRKLPTVQLRKLEKHEERKRRRNTDNLSNNIATTKNASDFSLLAKEDQSGVSKNKKTKLNTIDETIVLLMQQLRTLPPVTQSPVNKTNLLDLLQGARRLLCYEHDPTIGKFLAHGLLPLLHGIIRVETDANILYETIWILINITSSKTSSHVESVACSGVVPDIANLLVHDNPGVREQSIWFIANVAGESIQYRDALLEIPAVINGLLYNLEHPANISLLCNCAWAISNMFRALQEKHGDTVIRFIPDMISTLTIGIRGRVKTKELVDLMTALLYIVENGSEATALVLEAGVTPLLVTVIQHYSNFPEAALLLPPTIRILGNFAAGTDQQTEAVVQSGFLKHAPSLLDPSHKRLVHRAALFALSNIAAGTHDQISAMTNQRDLTESIVWLADHGPYEVKKEAIWTLTNVITKGKLKHATDTVAYGSISSLCDFLTKPVDTKLVLVVLESIEKLLMYNRSTELGFKELLEFCDGVQAIEDLQAIRNDAIYSKANYIITEFFDGVEDEDELGQNIAPLISDNATTFEFGTNALPKKQLFPEAFHVPTSHSNNSVTTSPFGWGGNVVPMTKMS
jgi:importin subunit alpha-6/7